MSEKILENQIVTSRKKGEIKNPSRRNFLKMMGIGLGVAVAETLPGTRFDLEKSVDELKKMMAENFGDADGGKKPIDYVEISTPNNFEQTVSKEEDAASVRDMVKFESEVRLGPEEFEKLKKHWEKRYEGDKKSDLDGALSRMKDWEAPAKKIFIDEGAAYCAREKMTEAEKIIFLTEFNECFYLSIPESYWKLDASSDAHAVGPFQFTSETAKTYHLERKNNFDTRRDPLKSAKAAAQNIIYLYESMNHDWGLALSGYNGGFVWKFRKEAVAKKEPVDYPNFLDYLGKRIERLRRELISAKTLKHEVLKGDTAEKIVGLYGMTKKYLADMNKHKNLDALEPGDRLVIIPTMENRKKNFYYHIEGFSQNINYPAKLNAVLMVLEKRKKETGRDCLNQKSNLPARKEISIKQERQFFEYSVKRGDTLSGVAAKFNLSEEEICLKNKLKKNAQLKAGIKLELKNKTRPKTLFSLAGFDAQKLAALTLLNPAVLDAKEALPDGIAIRFPIVSVENFLARK